MIDIVWNHDEMMVTIILIELFWRRILSVVVAICDDTYNTTINTVCSSIPLYESKGASKSRSRRKDIVRSWWVGFVLGDTLIKMTEEEGRLTIKLQMKSTAFDAE